MAVAKMEVTCGQVQSSLRAPKRPRSPPKRSGRPRWYGAQREARRVSSALQFAWRLQGSRRSAQSCKNSSS